MSNGTYTIPVWDTITTSWDKVYGAKKTFWGATFAALGILIIFAFVQGLVGKETPAGHTINFIGNVVGYFLQMGILYIGIKRAADMPIEYKQVFRAFNLSIAIKMVLLYIIQTLIFLPAILIIAGAVIISTQVPALAPILPIVVGILGGFVIIYLAIRLIISNSLVLDKEIGPWEAVKLSFRGTRGNFWPCLGLTLLQFIIFTVSLIPLGLGAIWTMPLTFIIFGLIYKRLQANLA